MLVREWALVVTCLVFGASSLGCGGGGDDDDGAGDGGGGGDGGADGEDEPARDGSSDDGSSDEPPDDTCDETSCRACLGAGESDCEDACTGCTPDDIGDGSGGGDGSESGDGSDTEPPIPEPTCNRDDQCGVSFECLSCGLNDGRGWCFQTEPCNFDSDCDVDEKCGYHVQSGDYRCLSAEYCQ